MIIASWNVRGLMGAHTHTQGVVVGLLKKHKIDVFGILETKMEELDELNQLMQQKFAGWYWVHFD